MSRARRAAASALGTRGRGPKYAPIQRRQNPPMRPSSTRSPRPHDAGFGPRSDPHLLPAAFGPLAPLLGEDALAEADLRRGDLDQLVVLDVLQGIFERELPWRLQQDVLVGAGGPHVRQLLF